MNSILQDIRYAIRSLTKTPGFALVAILSLALGIGANTTIFSVANALLYRPLPFHDPDRLVIIQERRDQRGFPRDPMLETILNWREHAQSFEQIEGIVHFPEASTLSGEGPAERVITQYVSQAAFSLLGVKPLLGREYTVEESMVGNRALIISYGLWQRRFGGSLDVLGKTLRHGDGRGKIIGVMPAGFWVTPGNQDIDIWIAIDLRVNELSAQTRWPTAYARLKPGVTIEQAQAEMTTFDRALAKEKPEAQKGFTLRVESVHDAFTRGAKSIVYMLLGAVGFILLIACANVANLLLSRASQRQKEIAVRASLGAGRGRLIQQLLTESLLLGLLGGALGIAVGFAGIRIFTALAPEGIPIGDVRIDVNVLLFTGVISLLTGILFGLVPSLRSARPDLVATLKEGGRTTSGGRRQRSSLVLVVSEVALAFVLLIGAGLMISSVSRLKQVDVGYNPEQLLTSNISLSSSKFIEMIGGDMKRVSPNTPMFFKQVLERVKTIPGVKSAAAAGSTYGPMRVIGRPEVPREQRTIGPIYEVSPGFFQTLNVPLIKGRLLDETDGAGAQWTCVVSETLVRRLFPNEDPLGKLLMVRFGAFATEGKEDQQPRVIVGVVGDVRDYGPAQDPQPVIYTSDEQHQWEFPSGGSTVMVQKSIYLRTAVADPMAVASALREAAAAVDPDQPLFNMRAETARIDETLGPWRFFQNLYTIFATLALVLAIVGIYGVISQSVSERRHEFGIRMALGAEKGNVLFLVLKQGLMVATIGVLIGAVAAFGLTRFLQNMLFEVKPGDPATFITVSIVMLLVALVSCYLPARRATTVNPVKALRHE